MFRLQAHPPTPSQIRSVAPIIPSHTPACPDIVPQLQCIIRLCQQDWINDFLFKTGPSHLAFFTAPSFKRDALTCKISFEHFEPDAPSGLPFWCRLGASVVFVPAFNVGNLGVGFGMEEKYAAFTKSSRTFPQCDVHPEHLRKEQFRYVCDDSTGLIVTVYDNGDTLTIEYAAHASSTCRQRCFCTLDRQRFFALLQQQQHQASGPTAGDVLQALKSGRSIVEYRRCPTCGAMPDAYCSCGSPLAPRDSLNIRRSEESLASHVGGFEGILHNLLFDEGTVFKRGLLGCLALTEGGRDRDLVDRLVWWAGRHNLGGILQDPMASILPPVGTTESYSGALQSTANDESYLACGADLGCSSIPGLDATAVNSPSFSPVLPCNVSLQDSADTVGGDPGLNSLFTLLLPETMLATGITSISEPIQEFWVRTDIERNTENATECRETERDRVPQSESWLEPGNGATREEDGKGDTTVEVCEASGSGKGRKSTAEADSADEVSSTVAPELAQEALRKGGASGVKGNDEELDEDKEIERKEEIRRERNRVAARRSNFKRRARNQAQKTELETLRRLEKAMRAREVQLREENRWLRSRFYKNGLYMSHLD